MQVPTTANFLLKEMQLEPVFYQHHPAWEVQLEKVANATELAKLMTPSLKRTLVETVSGSSPGSAGSARPSLSGWTASTTARAREMDWTCEACGEHVLAVRGQWAGTAGTPGPNWRRRVRTDRPSAFPVRLLRPVLNAQYCLP